VVTFAGATFTADPSAAGLLTYSSGAQLTLDRSSVTSLEIGALSAVAVVNATLNVTGSTFSGNNIGDGASVLLLNSTDTTISGSTFSRNIVTQFGGAVSVGSGNLVVEDSTFTGNSAGGTGGAIDFKSTAGSSATFQNVTFASNVATCRGGSLSISGVDTISLAACTFTNSSVLEWPNSPDSGGQCLTALRLAYTAGDAMFADKFSLATFTSTSFDRTNGNGDGAVFLNAGLRVRLQDVNVTNTVLTNGRTAGFLLASTTVATMNRCNVVNNTAASNGGIQLQNCNAVNVTNSIFRDNEGSPNSADNGFGGALFMNGGCIDGCLVDGNTFTSNRVTKGDGGGFYAQAPATLVVSNNKFTGNLAGQTGGGMSINGAGQGALTKNSLVLQGNTFANNTVTGSIGTGGGFVLNLMPSMQIADCAFAGNTASQAGGGMAVIALDTSSFSATNLTFTSNIVQARNGPGGGLFVQSGAVNASQLVLTGNTAGIAGGVFLANMASATFTGANFTNNAAILDSGSLHAEGTQLLSLSAIDFINTTVTEGFGGAILLSSVDNTTFSDCTFTGCSAAKLKGQGGAGGALYVTGAGSGLNIDRCQFTSGSAQDDAGAVFVQGIGTLAVTNSNFTSNAATGDGGGLYLSDNLRQTVSGSTFTANSANNGGGIAGNNATSALSLSAVTLRSNRAASGGGLFLNQMPNGTALDVTGSTITNNTASDFGGGIAFVQSPGVTLTIASSTVSNNKADAGGGLYGDNGVLFASTGLRQTGNAATSAADTANLGCGSCQSSANGGTAATVSNADAFSTASNTVIPGEPSDGGGGGGGGISGGAIAGIVIGVLAGIALLAIAVWYCLRRRRARRGDMEMAKHHHDSPMSAAASGNKVPSAFAAEGNGSFWSQPRSNLNGAYSDKESLALAGFDTDKTARTAETWASNSSAPLINLHSGSVTSHGTLRTDVTFPEVPWSEWHIDARDIQVARRDDGREWKLGGGAFGEVYKAMLKGVNPVAVKVLRDQSYTSRDEFGKEVGLLKTLHNSNIVQFQGACLEEDKMLLITEFMDGGDLFKAIARKQVTWKLRGRSICIDVLRGLHFLHSKRVVHMDLKSPNILLTRHGDAKLADVGLAKVIRDRNYITQVSVIGTFAWAAPEVLTNEKCTEKADIFSFGIVLWEIVTGEQPVRGGRRDARVPEECSQEVSDIIDACLRTDPQKRPTASEVLELLQAMSDPSDAAPDAVLG
jgi:hypothetical protein